MGKTDIAIVGAGLAGSLCAGMLEKQGISHKLIDPRAQYPDEFRCEKFGTQQIELLKTTGLDVPVLDELTSVNDVWIARFGRLIRKKHYPHFGFSYNEVVNAIQRALSVPKLRQQHVRAVQCHVWHHCPIIAILLQLV